MSEQEYLRLPHGMFDRDEEWIKRERAILENHAKSGEKIGCKLKKYSPLESLDTVASKYVDIFNQVIKHNIIVTDRDKVIAIAGSLKKNYLDKEISDFTEHSIDRRDSFVERQKKNFEFVEGIVEYGYYSFSSIVNNGDALGAVIIISTDFPISEADEKQAVILARILSRYFIE